MDWKHFLAGLLGVVVGYIARWLQQNHGAP